MKKLIVCCIVLSICLLALPVSAAVVVYKVTANATVLAVDVNGAEPNTIQNINLKGVLVADVNTTDENKPIIENSTIIWHGHGQPDSKAFVARFGSIAEANSFVVDNGCSSHTEVLLEIRRIAGRNKVVLIGKVPKGRGDANNIIKRSPSLFKGSWTLNDAKLSFLGGQLGDDVLHGSGNITMTLDVKQSKDANSFDHTVHKIAADLRRKVNLK